MSATTKIYISSLPAFNVTARGEAAHGSTLPEFTAGQRLQAAIDQINEYRKEQFAKLQTPNITLGDLTVFNLVMLGVKIFNGKFAA